MIGGALGATFGQACVMYLPGVAPDPVSCIMVGMGGFFAGDGLLVPSLLAAAIAYLALPPSVRLYENQVPSRIDSPAHLGSFAADILRAATVGDSWEPAQPRVRCIEQDALISSLIQQVSGLSQNLFPVVDGAGHLIGEFSIEDVRRALPSEPDAKRLTARGLMHPAVAP